MIEEENWIVISEHCHSAVAVSSKSVHFQLGAFFLSGYFICTENLGKCVPSGTMMTLAVPILPFVELKFLCTSQRNGSAAPYLGEHVCATHLRMEIGG